MPNPVSSLVSEFHKRAGYSHAEARKLLTGLAVGSVGVFYATLTGTNRPVLDGWSKWLAIISLGLMASSAGFGLAAWRADAAWAYRAAIEFERDSTLTSPYQGAAHFIKKWCDLAQLFLFMLGLLAAAVLTFLLLR
jgi:hypothetical protein